MTEPSTDPARPVIVLFRHDLRLSDNRALAEAVASGRPLVAAFVRDERGVVCQPGDELLG